MVADLAQDVDASKGLTVASKDGIHLLAVEVGPVQVSLVLAQLAEQHLRWNRGSGVSRGVPRSAKKGGLEDMEVLPKGCYGAGKGMLRSPGGDPWAVKGPMRGCQGGTRGRTGNCCRSSASGNRRLAESLLVLTAAVASGGCRDLCSCCSHLTTPVAPSPPPSRPSSAQTVICTKQTSNPADELQRAMRCGQGGELVLCSTPAWENGMAYVRVAPKC